MKKHDRTRSTQAGNTYHTIECASYPKSPVKATESWIGWNDADECSSCIREKGDIYCPFCDGSIAFSLDRYSCDNEDCERFCY